MECISRLDRLYGEEWKPRLNPAFVKRAQQNNKMRAKMERKLKKEKPKPDTKPFYQIVDRICRACGVSQQAVFFGGKQREVALARQAVCYWVRRRTDLSLPEIGRLMGGKHHTSIMQGRDAYVQKRAKMGRTLRKES